MKVCKKFLSCFVISAVLYACSVQCLPVWADEVAGSSEPQETVLDGWQEIDGKVYYYIYGQVQIGLQTIGEETYYFAPDTGEMQTGLQDVGKNTYYFAPGTGEMQTGWQESGGETYYFAPDTGEMQTGRQEIEEDAYYFNEDGILETAGWIETENGTYYCDQKGILSAGKKKIGGKTYYFSPKNNKMKTGWQKVNGKKYYFTPSGEEKGVMQKNCIAGTKKAGYFYVDGSGVQVTAAEVKKAVQFVVANTDLSKSRDAKLRQCFDALWKSCTYQRFYETPTASSMPGYANYMFTNKRGNCYRYAASFAYIAKVLGYESRVYIGSISSAHGGMTPHGWTEVKVNGTWYMCDANMQRNHSNIDSYMRTDGNYHYRHTRSKAFTLQIKKGKVSWT